MGTGKPFLVDYCKRGTTKCKRCKKQISRGELRIGKSTQFKNKYIFQYLHTQCAFESFKKARLAANTITGIDDIDGFDLINDDDRVLILQMIDNTKTERKRPFDEPKDTLRKSKRIPFPSELGYRPRLSSVKASTLKIMYTNADQLTPSKKMELIKRIELHKPLVVAVCEAKPKNSKEHSLLDYDIPNFTLHPTNLDKKDVGRGIAIYSHESIDRSVIQVKSEVAFNEACMLEVRLRGGDTLLLGCCYRSPTKTATSDNNNNNLNAFLKWVAERKHSHKCIMGDFNYKRVNWATCSTTESENSDESKFLDTLRDSFLHQQVGKPTRRRGNDEPSLLDLVLTNEAMQVSNLCHLSPLGKSDHDVLVFDYHGYLDYTKPKEKFVYERADYSAMRNDPTNTTWCEEFMRSAQFTTLRELWNNLKHRIHELRKKHVPTSKVSLRSWKKGSFPLDEKTREAIRIKDKKHRLWMNTSGVTERQLAKDEYTKARNKANSLLRRAKRTFERGVANDAKTIPKRFWYHARRKLKTKTGIPPLLADVMDKESLRYDDAEKAEILQRQFLSVFSPEEDTVATLPASVNVEIGNIIIGVEAVRDMLKNINVNKSLGPDDIHPRILHELADILSAPITILFNRSIQGEELPDDWKLQFVSPIYKKGQRSLAENYRPISLTCILCKILESMVRTEVLTHLLTNNVLSTRQFGFINGRSTTLQLLHFLDLCTQSIVQGNVVDTIYFDFKKAFDMVPHKRLVAKLESYGIKGKLLRWIEEFLTGRQQYVIVNGEKSSPGRVTSGIPQGTVLGPLLFVVYINDILENLSAEGFLFADDTKIFRAITSRDDSLNLQSDIDALEKWSKKWGMEFNRKKCHVLSLGKFENTKHTHRYQLGGDEIEHVFMEKDLGITIDSELTYEEHIANKVRVANGIVGLMRRSFSYLDPMSFKKLFCAFVRPHLEYGQSVWAPHLQKNINALEKVQIRATKLVDGLKNLEYEERLRRCDLTTLRFRRMRGDMIEMWKHFNVYDRDILSPSFTPNERPVRNGNHKFQLYQRRSGDGERGVQTNSYYFRTTEMWNGLPTSVVESKTVDSFKNNLDKAWEDHPMKYQHQSNL